jgi:hypothetical protein
MTTHVIAWKNTTKQLLNPHPTTKTKAPPKKQNKKKPKKQKKQKDKK